MATSNHELFDNDESGNAPPQLSENSCPSLAELASKAIAFPEVYGNKDEEACQTHETGFAKRNMTPEILKMNLEEIKFIHTRQSQHPNDCSVTVTDAPLKKDALPANQYARLDNKKEPKGLIDLGLPPLMTSLCKEDERPKKATYNFGKLLSKYAFIRNKNKKPKKRASSLCNIAGQQGKENKHLQSLQTEFRYIGADDARAEKEKEPIKGLLTTGSRSIHVCCGMATGRGDYGNETDQEWSLNADISSVDGSCFSDSSVDDPEAISHSQHFQSGAGSTDTDTDGGAGSARKKVSWIKTMDGEPISERIGQIPSLLIFFSQAMREFKWHRFYFSHYENVDFSVFEFGNRNRYLMWRCACLLATMLLFIDIYLEHGVRGLHIFPLTDIDICLHLWLTWLFLFQLTIEVVVLIVQYFLYPTCYLARVHTTPIYWKLVWFLNNIISANVLSLVLMNAIVFKKSDITIAGVGSKVHICLTMMNLVQISIGAMPIRLAHGFHPMLLTLMFILYVNIYRPCSSFPKYKSVPLVSVDFRTPDSDLTIDLCYIEPLMWNVDRSCCLIFGLFWVVATLTCHCALVLVCWLRRVVFRHRREHSAPVYGQSPTTHFYPEYGAEVSPEMIRMVEENGFKAKDFVTGYDISPPMDHTVLRQRRWKNKSLLKAEQAEALS